MKKNYNQFYDEIYSQDNPEGEAHGWIQWKGTNVCVDLYCSCGYHGHIDADFFYLYECKGCGKRYAVGENIKLIPLTQEQIDFEKKSGATFLIDDDIKR